MKEIKTKTKILLVLTTFLIVSIFIYSPILIVNYIFAEENNSKISEEILDLNDSISQKKDEIDKLKKQSSKYERNIRQKRSESVNLVNQINLTENQIAKTEIDIETTGVEIDQTKLEIKNTNLQITNTEKDINKRKNTLINYLQKIRKNDDIGYLEVLILKNSFSEFFDQVKNLENIQGDLRDVLGEVATLKENLDQKMVKLETQKKDLEKFEITLNEQKDKLGGEILSKEILLEDTKQSEVKFQEMLAQLKREQQSINSDIVALEKTIRQKLEANDSNFNLGDGEILLSWPVPFKKITTYFHDPDYPFRYIFEHPGIDLRASQGTPIRAPAPGYVARVRDNGFGYSYIMLIHSGGISTVYGHVSGFAVVEDQYVTRGQIIGYTGGTPGTLGAGRLTTGPHLHFEVRLDGIPVNPLNYMINF